MAEITVHAIVLRRQDSGESDRRLTLLTRERGKMDAVAKGARKAASRLAGTSDPLSVATFSIAEGKRNCFITQAQPVTSFRGLRRDYERLTFGVALAELYAAVLPYEQPLAEEFDLLVASLTALEVHERPLVALVWAEARLLDIAGFMPQLERCVLTDRPVWEREPSLSPAAGGYVTFEEASRFTDRFTSRPEVLIGLARVSLLPTPPERLGYAAECLSALLPFWRHVAERKLPANEGIVREVRHFSSEANKESGASS